MTSITITINDSNSARGKQNSRPVRINKPANQIKLVKAANITNRVNPVSKPVVKAPVRKVSKPVAFFNKTKGKVASKLSKFKKFF